MKALSLTSQDMANVKVFADTQTDKRIGQKLYAPYLSMRGIKIKGGGGGMKPCDELLLFILSSSWLNPISPLPTVFSTCF